MDTLQLIDKVHSFYSDSFTLLMTLTFGILAIIGIIMPLLLQLIQNRIFRSGEKSLETLIKAETQKAESNLKIEIEKMFATEKEIIATSLKVHASSLTKTLDERTSEALAGVYYLQGKMHLADGIYFLATKSLADAIRNYLKGKNEGNAKVALNSLLDDCLGKLDNSSFEDYQSLESDINDLLEELELHNDYDRYRVEISRIKREVSRAKKATPGPPSFTK